jgi:4'-phosphopantetheinyl transferase
VRKEAWIKALGTGLSTPLADFRVSLDERGQTERWMLEAGPTGQAENWTFTTPAPLPEPCSLAAVAVEGPEVRLRWREWRDFTPLST